MAIEIKVDSAAAIEAAKGFGSTGEAMSDASAQVEDAINSLASFEGDLAVALKETMGAASEAQKDLGGITTLLGRAISGIEARWTNEDEKAAARIR